MEIKRVFLIVLDSFGIGEMPDAGKYGDEGSNTLRAIVSSPEFSAPNLQKLGLFNIEGVELGREIESPLASFARLSEASVGKDTTTGHREMAGLISKKKLPTFPNGFPEDFLEAFSKETGRGRLLNKPYSGTDAIRDYGKEHLESGKLIVYTSADSVFQIAAHEDLVSPEELYSYCKIARKMLQGEDLGVGRVIARPFVGEEGAFVRTSNRHDFSLTPPGPTLLDELSQAGLSSIGVGKIYDIFAGRGINESYKMKDNEEGMEVAIRLLDKDFEGLCFVNLVDFDMIYGHRNDVDGYAGAISLFDRQLGEFLSKMNENDLLMITADHGCDPSTPSTDHSREYVPFLAYGRAIKEGVDLKTRESFSDIGKTIGEIFDLPGKISGKSFYREIQK